MKMSAEDKKYVDDFLTKIIRDFTSGNSDRQSAIMGALAQLQGALIATVSRDEVNLLDGIDLCSKHIRTVAADVFVSKQKYHAQMRR